MRLWLNILQVRRTFWRKITIFPVWQAFRLQQAVFAVVAAYFIFSGGALRAQSLRGRTENRFRSFFIKDEAVKNYLSTTGDSLFIYSNAASRAKNEKPEIALSWNDAELLSHFIDKLSEKKLKNILDSINFYKIPKNDSNSGLTTVPVKTVKAEDLPLAGIKVAIDPGHIGGAYAMAEAESRCMTLYCDSNGKCDTFRIIEGNLTFFTALLLKKKLELLGARVMLTRKDTGISSLGITFGEWKRRIRRSAYVDSIVKANLLAPEEVRLLRLLRLHMADKTLFGRVFGSVDMAERAKKMNDFHPDISVIIHYNVNEQNIGWRQPTPKDFVMAFVGGCVVSKDLKSEAGRLNFLRLLISPDIDSSVSLSGKVIRHLSADLGVPIAAKEDARYLSRNCLPTPAAGVYSRDLALTRLTRGALVYGEALYQDNDRECRLLAAKDGHYQGFSFPARVETVAEAYYKGIMDYLGGKN